jgi:hypothetical protein
MARKSKSGNAKPAKPAHTEPPPANKKRKIDWSTVDDFEGFQVKNANVKANKKQKTVTQASECASDGRCGAAKPLPGGGTECDTHEHRACALLGGHEPVSEVHE